jgi:transposase
VLLRRSQIGFPLRKAILAAPHELRQLLTDAIRRDGWDASRIGEFEMDVRYAGDAVPPMHQTR